VCPCGKGHVLVDVVTLYNGWSTDTPWSGKITCTGCAVLYSLVPFSRGVALVRTDDHQQRQKMHADAVAQETALLESGEVQEVLALFAEELESLSTSLAKYKLVKQLQIESRTLATFRKHIRGITMRQWLEPHFRTYDHTDRTLKSLLPLFKHVRRDTYLIEKCLGETAAWREQASEMPDVVMSLGSINWFAAVGDPGRSAAAVREAIRSEE
jgi:hypothetical protein